MVGDLGVLRGRGKDLLVDHNAREVRCEDGLETVVHHIFTQKRVAAARDHDTRLSGDIGGDDLLEVAVVQVPLKWLCELRVPLVPIERLAIIRL